MENLTRKNNALPAEKMLAELWNDALERLGVVDEHGKHRSISERTVTGLF